MTGAEAAEALHEINMTVNMNLIPFDKRKVKETSGIRVGTPCVTTRGMKEADMRALAEIMDECLRKRNDNAVKARPARPRRRDERVVPGVPRALRRNARLTDCARVPPKKYQVLFRGPGGGVMSEEEPRGENDLQDTLIAAAPLFGWAFAALSFAVMVLTFPGRHTHAVIVPSLIPVFGVPFAVAFAAVQIAVLAGMKSYKGLAAAVGLMLLGGGLAWVAMRWGLGFRDMSAPGFTTARHVLAGGACVAGLFTGVGLIRGWLP